MPGRRILVVDDDPDIIDYFSSFLADEGYEVASASSSEDALEMIDGFQPSAILIDVMMPGRSGLDLLVSLRGDPDWRDTPLILITGSDQIVQDDCQSYLGSHKGVRGSDEVLAKPLDRSTLLAALERLGA